MADNSSLGSLRLKDNYRYSDKSAFQEDDGRYDEGFTEGGGLDQAALRRGLKFKALGLEIVNTLCVLVKNVKVHTPDNEVFLKPIDTLREAMNRLVATERHLTLQAADTTVYLNGNQLGFEFRHLEAVRYLTKEFKTRDIGGFSTHRPVNSAEIRDFLQLFVGEVRAPPPEDDRSTTIRIARYAKVKELLDKLQADPDLDEKIDRKKYLLTVYARAVFFMRKYLERLESDQEALPFAKAGRIIQDLVDLCFEVRAHFLGVTTTRVESEYLPHHSVNTALLSIVFGQELGLDKRQLHELGMAALFAAIGLVGVPHDIMTRRKPLSLEERQVIDLYPIRSARRILATRGLDRTTMNRIVAAYESRVDYAVPRRSETGDVELVMPKLGLGAFGRVIAICDTYDALTSKRPFREAYGPEIALALMSSELKYRFDPDLLRVFMKVMAIQPIKILGEGSSLRIA